MQLLVFLFIFCWVLKLGYQGTKIRVSPFYIPYPPLKLTLITSKPISGCRKIPFCFQFDFIIIKPPGCVRFEKVRHT